jgi:THO complex subunit 2
LVNETSLFERLEADMLQSLGLVKRADDFNRRLQVAYTKLSYTLRKYQLFREEPEGYAKVLTELNQSEVV